MAVTQYYGTGRRKTSSARVFLRPGTGKFTVNGKELGIYFNRKVDVVEALSPLKVTDLGDKFDAYITVKGGGSTGQAGAIRLGVARALLKYDETDTSGGDGEGALGLRPVLRSHGFLTRDSREVERKKYGLKKARKSEQYSKR